MVDDPDTAVRFDGGTDRLVIQNSPTFALSAGTIQFFFNADTLTGNDTLISKISGGIGSDEFVIRLDEVGTGNTADLELDLSGTDDDITSFRASGENSSGPGVIQAGTTYHVALTWDGSTVTLYLDGARVGFVDSTFGLTSSNAAEDFFIGDNNGTDEFDGLIDELAIFDRALSFQEINQIIDDAEAGLEGPPATSEFQGDDTIEAGTGADTLIGGLGDDLLDGGIDVDIDTYVFNLQADDGLGNGDGDDIVRNFGSQDILRFENVVDAVGGGDNIDDLDDAIASIDDGVSDLVINFDNGSSITVEGAGGGTGNTTTQSITDFIDQSQIQVDVS